MGPIEKRKVDVFKDSFVVVGQDLTHPVHREDYLFVCHMVFTDVTFRVKVVNLSQIVKSQARLKY